MWPARAPASTALPKVIATSIWNVKLIYSTEDLKLAMKLLLGQRARSARARRNFFSTGDSEADDKFVPVNKDTINWAYHVLDRMVFEPSWRVRFR